MGQMHQMQFSNDTPPAEERKEDSTVLDVACRFSSDITLCNDREITMKSVAVQPVGTPDDMNRCTMLMQGLWGEMV